MSDVLRPADAPDRRLGAVIGEYRPLLLGIQEIPPGRVDDAGRDGIDAPRPGLHGEDRHEGGDGGIGRPQARRPGGRRIGGNGRDEGDAAVGREIRQGRDVRPSAEVLSALADALKLDPAERRHLFLLAGRPAPEPVPSGPERVEEPLRRMLASLTTQPALVVGRRWDVLAWNRAATVVFGDYARLEGDARNMMHLVFVNPAHRQLLVDWDKVAPVSLAMFRADSARHAGDPDFERLIALLKSASPEFRQWWPRHEVLQPLSGHKRIEHPAAGRMLFDYTSLAATDQPDLKLVVFTPLEEAQTAAKLARLLSRDDQAAA